mgnify:FL=1
MPETCPCGSNRAYDACCAPLHRSEAGAPTAEALMRSRYSAYALGLADYLLATWATATRPGTLSLDEAASRWIGLEIRTTRAGGETDTQGEVEFVARAIGGEQLHRLHEVSRFCREEGAWRYLDGVLAPDAPVKIGRNMPCPCGSGRKFKRCHGA